MARIGDVCRVLPGYAFSSKDWREDGIPVIKIKNIQADCTIDLGETDCVPESILTPKLEKFALSDADILIAMTGATAGKVGKLRTSRVVLLNQRVAKIEPFAADKSYIWSVVISQDYQSRFFNLADGAAQPNMSGTQIEGVEIPLPPPPIQTIIGGILAAYDDLIENNTRRFQILEQMAQGLYREWFVNFRFPSHANVKLVESPLGKIPHGWSVRRLDEVAAVNTLSIRRGQEPDRILYVDIASVATGHIDKIEEMAFANAPGRARRIVGHGDTIWSCVRPNRKSFSLILNPPADLIVSTGFAVLTPSRVPSSFLHQAVTTDEFVGYLTNHATGAAYPAVTAKDFEAAKMLVPDESLLERFHAHCEPLLLLKENLLRENANLRRTRDLLLPKLISGALSVENMEVA
jgi:type I restriction enzyme S subunit